MNNDTSQISKALLPVLGSLGILVYDYDILLTRVNANHFNPLTVLCKIVLHELRVKHVHTFSTEVSIIIAESPQTFRS